MKKEEFFDEWKGDWKERKEEFHTNQAELFRHIMDRKNLEIKSSLRLQEKDRGMCSIKSRKS